jgi:hypothetical protein
MVSLCNVLLWWIISTTDAEITLHSQVRL